MKPPATKPLPRPLNDNQRAALVTLLGDDDPAVFAAVRQRILDEGPAALEWLGPLARGANPVVRRHARRLVRVFGRQEADIAMLHFCLTHGDELPLEEGVWLLARTQHPEFSEAGCRALLDDWAGELREPLARAGRGDGVIAVLNELLFRRLRFTGDPRHHEDPDNSYFNRVLDRRRGNPISLCTVALLVGRRAGLPLVGVGMPGHFICRYQTPAHSFYVDFFHEGRVLRRADCVQFLQQTGREFRDDFLAPVNGRRMLLRMCANLERIHAGRGEQEASERCRRYLVALGR